MSKRLAAVFRRAVRREAAAPSAAARRLTLPDLLRLHGGASAPVLLLLLATLSVIPVAGVGTLLSFVILALAWRWHRGVDAEILPERIGRLALSRFWSYRCLRFLAWTYATANRFLRKRWTPLCHRSTHPWWGAWIALMGLVILLPLPLGNVLPGVSLVLLSLGWMFRDGLALLLSTVVGSIAIGFTLAMSHVLLQGAQAGLVWLNLQI